MSSNLFSATARYSLCYVKNGTDRITDSCHFTDRPGKQTILLLHHCVYSTISGKPGLFALLVDQAYLLVTLVLTVLKDLF